MGRFSMPSLAEIEEMQAKIESVTATHEDNEFYVMVSANKIVDIRGFETKSKEEIIESINQAFSNLEQEMGKAMLSGL